MLPCLLKETDGLLDASVDASILEGLDEMSTVTGLKLPAACPVRSPAPTEPRISSQVGLTITPMR
jgi:hypothetical protein